MKWIGAVRFEGFIFLFIFSFSSPFFRGAIHSDFFDIIPFLLGQQLPFRPDAETSIEKSAAQIEKGILPMLVAGFLE